MRHLLPHEIKSIRLKKILWSQIFLICVMCFRKSINKDPESQGREAEGQGNTGARFPIDLKGTFKLAGFDPEKFELAKEIKTDLNKISMSNIIALRLVCFLFWKVGIRVFSQDSKFGINILYHSNSRNIQFYKLSDLLIQIYKI